MAISSAPEPYVESVRNAAHHLIHAADACTARLARRALDEPLLIEMHFHKQRAGAVRYVESGRHAPNPCAESVRGTSNPCAESARRVLNPCAVEQIFINETSRR